MGQQPGQELTLPSEALEAYKEAQEQLSKATDRMAKVINEAIKEQTPDLYEWSIRTFWLSAFMDPDWNPE